MYDVRVLNKYGVWQTDLTTGSKHRAQDRGKFLVPRAHAVKVYENGRPIFLED